MAPLELIQSFKCELVVIETESNVTVRVLWACQNIADTGRGSRPIRILFLRHRKMVGAILEREASCETMTASRHADLRRHTTEERIARVLTLARVNIKLGPRSTVAGPACQDQGPTAK